eukprot:Awhi_evm2s5191
MTSKDPRIWSMATINCPSMIEEEDIIDDIENNFSGIGITSFSGASTKAKAKTISDTMSKEIEMQRKYSVSEKDMMNLKMEHVTDPGEERAKQINRRKAYHRLLARRSSLRYRPQDVNDDNRHANEIFEMQTAAFLAVASSFLLVEGCTRVALRVNLGLDHGWTSNSSDDVILFPEAALIAASVAEVVFALAGFFVAFLTLMYGVRSYKLTLVALIIEQLGWYTFIVFTLAHRIYTYHGTLPGLDDSKGLSNFVIACNIFGSVCYCATLQGAEMFFTFKLLRQQKGDITLFRPNFYRLFLFLCSFLLLLCGLGQWWSGAMTLSKIGHGPLSQPVALPFIHVFPELNIFVGVVMTVSALYAISLAATYQIGSLNVGKITGGYSHLAPVMLFTWLSQLICMGLVQNSYGSVSWLTATLTGNTFTICFLTVYMDAKMRIAYDKRVKDANDVSSKKTTTFDIYSSQKNLTDRNLTDRKATQEIFEF